jgi:hypothetical protein
MGHGNIILPSGPVVIVYKGWRRGKRKPDDDPNKPGGRDKYPTDEIAVTSMESPSIGGISLAEPQHNAAGRPNPGISRNFQFVNATKPQRNRDPDVRKLVRTHVMKEFGRDRRQQKRREKERRTSSSESSVDSKDESKENSPRSDMEVGLPSPGQSSLCSGAAMPFYGRLPMEMRPHFPRLLDYCMPRAAQVYGQC